MTARTGAQLWPESQWQAGQGHSILSDRLDSQEAWTPVFFPVTDLRLDSHMLPSTAKAHSMPVAQKTDEARHSAVTHVDYRADSFW